ncbi:hypothetical protein [Levilactobacillus brevis]|uniref:hypothetical protein n=1 Tax=Levilactobacillus brevis TaxID=1580 RepID=UPI0035A2AEE7
MSHTLSEPYDITRVKALLDGNQCHGFTSDKPFFEVTDKGILLRLIYGSKALKNFDPHNFKGIIVDENATVITDMAINKYKMLPFKVGVYAPVVEIMLYGTPHNEFMD